MHAMRVATIVAALIALAACRPPSVAEDTIDKLEGPHVAIVSQETMPNPTDQWTYTYAVLEVTGTGSHIDRISSVLSENGWNIQDSSALLLLAYLTKRGNSAPETELILDKLECFLDAHKYDKLGERFSAVTIHDDRTYYVAILTPLNKA